MSDCCLACGGEALKGSRAAASGISVFLKTYLTRRLEEEGIEADLDSIIGCSCACRACFKAYTTHQQKDERLYGATANTIANLQSIISASSNPMRRVAANSDPLPVTKKRCIGVDTTMDSPPIVVSSYCN